MNKQEAIELLRDVAKRACYRTGRRSVHIDEIVELVNQIDKPQKIAVPQMIFDVIESFDEDIYHLHEHMSSQSFEVRDWLTHNEREFYEAWLAYPNIVVEKEEADETDETE